MRWPSNLAYALGGFVLAAAPAAAQESGAVALELVLAIDCSTSVDREEYELQRAGLAAAFRDPAVLGAIRGLGPQGMAVAVVQWAGRRNATLSLPWMRISGEADAEAVAQGLDAMARRVNGRTDIYTAIDFAHRSIETNAFEGERKTIDVSGDGSSDLRDPAPARDAAVSAGVTVNGLAIYSDDYDLGELANLELYTHYRDRVIGGQGAFLMEALNHRDFADAIRRKLVREISGPAVSSNRFAEPAATR